MWLVEESEVDDGLESWGKLVYGVLDGFALFLADCGGDWRGVSVALDAGSVAMDDVGDGCSEFGRVWDGAGFIGGGVDGGAHPVLEQGGGSAFLGVPVAQPLGYGESGCGENVIFIESELGAERLCDLDGAGHDGRGELLSSLDGAGLHLAVENALLLV